MTVHLCQISRKNHFRSPVCKNYSYFLFHIFQYRPFKHFKTQKCFLLLFDAARKQIVLGLSPGKPISPREKHYSLVCFILWVFSTSKKPIGILNLKPWTEFDFTPLNRYLRLQLSFISEEIFIVSSVTLPSPLEMLSNPVNLPCGTKCWREFNIF